MARYQKVTDYIFYNSWQPNELGLTQGLDYLVLKDLDDLHAGQIVTFAGFDDIDNHYGIFVFIDSQGQILEVKGDFSGPDHSKVKELRLAIANVQTDPAC